MNQIKPYLFWVILGAVLLLELAWWLLSIPDLDVVGNKAAAIESKAKLKIEEDHLKELSTRAKRNSPTGVFDAEKDADIRRLTNDYLQTPAWESVLRPHVEQYNSQLESIKTHLIARSLGLTAEIAASSDKFGWYTAYQNQTEALLKRLHAAKSLAIPAPAPKPATTSASDAKPATTGPEVLDFAGDANLRSLAGLFTKGANLPEPAEHPLLTRQFRTIERLTEILLGVNVTNDENPLSGVADQPEPVSVAFAGVTWDDKHDRAVLGQGVSDIATGWRLTLNLRGSLSGILAAVSAFGHPAGENKPLIAITGCQIERKSNYVAGERKNVGSELVQATVSLVVLDFAHPPTSAGEPTSANPKPPASTVKPVTEQESNP